MEHTEAIWQQRLAKRRGGMPWKAIIEAEGYKYGGTFTGQLKNARQRGWIPPEETLPPAIRSDGRRQGLLVPKQETPMVDDVVEVLPGQITIEDTDTAALPEVYTSAVGEFDVLPDGYATTIQPMREYSPAEEFALNESMRLFGFVGAVVRDQYGRILDGNQRQRVARQRGLAVPYTITEVRDDAHALAVATSLNAVRRQYPRAEREQIALSMRDQGFSYRVIAAALGVSKDTVQRDIFGGFKIIPAHESEAEIVSHETIPRDAHETTVSHETIAPVTHESPARAPAPVARVKRKGGGTYPAQRPTTIGKGQAEETRERLGERGQPNSSWINVLSQAHRLCSSLARLPDRDEIFTSWGLAGRQKALDYLEPLSHDIKQLLWSLHAIDAKPLDTE